MELDIAWNINALLVWYSWQDDWWGLLTDTIMLASFNPKLGAVTFLSIPRDLWVVYERWRKDKINGLYRATYLDNEKSKQRAIQSLQNKVQDITWVDIPYYMVVDFDGFIEFIDGLWGIEVDVKEAIYDPYFPDAFNGYEVFAISWGTQTIDGETALKYARSRKTTSDFSRSLRQQQIIKWVIKKALWSLSLTNIGAMKTMYADFESVVETNVTMPQMLGVIQYLEDINHYFSYVYTADCNPSYLETADPWCMLVYGSPAEYGSSLLVPKWANYYNLSYYVNTKDFAFRVTAFQDVLMERAKISVYNGIDKQRAKADWYNVNGVASQLALDMKVRALDVIDIANADSFYEKTTVFIPGNGRYPKTVAMLWDFVDFTEVMVDPTWTYGTWGISIVLGYDFTKKL